MRLIHSFDDACNRVFNQRQCSLSFVYSQVQIPTRWKYHTMQDLSVASPSNSCLWREARLEMAQQQRQQDTLRRVSWEELSKYYYILHSTVVPAAAAAAETVPIWYRRHFAIECGTSYKSEKKCQKRGKRQSRLLNEYCSDLHET